MFRFGIMGAGVIAEKFCHAVKLVDDTAVVAVSGKDPIKTKEFACRNQIPVYYTHYAEMLEQERLDAVYIATTNHLHYSNLMLAIHHAVPVLCEKPMTMTAAEAVEVFQAARLKSVFVMEAMWSRFLPGYIKTREWIRSGCIGKVASAAYDIGFRANGESRVFDPATGGGALYDIGIYGVEGIQGLVDDRLVSSCASVIYSDRGVDLSTHLMLTFTSFIASVRCSIVCDMPSFTVINGTEGRIQILDVNTSARKVILTGAKGDDIFISDVSNGFEYEISHFIQCVKRRLPESPVIPHADTLLCAEVFDRTFGRKKAEGI